MKKNFVIGEYCLGGIIEIRTVNNSHVFIICKDYSTKKEIEKQVYSLTEKDSILYYLNDLTSCYYADKIYNYIFSK